MPNKAIFLDRDDTLIEDPGFISHPDQVKLLDDVAEALVELRRMGYKLIVVSNQSGVARGIVTEEALDEIHERLMQLLAEQGAHLDKIYYCPYHPEGVIPKYRKESDRRKPSPGMLLNAAKELDIDLSQSWIIGDRNRDIQAGRQAGCNTILVTRSSTKKQPGSRQANPDYKSVNMREAVNIIKKHHRSSRTKKDLPQSPVAEETRPVEQILEEPNRPVPTRTESSVEEPGTGDMTTEQLLSGILEQLRRMHRSNMFTEFSAMRLLAGVVQILVLFCLVITIWLLMSPTRQDTSVLIALGFAMVFQLMSLTFYIMQGRK
jgi:D-glycero-D-manno-heptose 1,7-bisphosphate phosphatase